MTPTKLANLIMSVLTVSSVFQYKYQEALGNIMQMADMATALWQGTTLQVNPQIPGNASWQLNGVDVALNINTTYANRNISDVSSFSIAKGPLGKATSKLKFLSLVLRWECDINKYFE